MKLYIYNKQKRSYYMFKKIMIILIFLLLAIGVASAHDDKAYSSIDIKI